MRIISHAAVRAAYERALDLDPARDHDESVLVTAVSLCLSTEAVEEALRGAAQATETQSN